MKKRAKKRKVGETSSSSTLEDKKNTILINHPSLELQKPSWFIELEQHAKHMQANMHYIRQKRLPPGTKLEWEGRLGVIDEKSGHFRPHIEAKELQVR